MRIVFVSLISVVLVFSMIGRTDADLISFVDPLTNIEDTTGWSSSDGMVVLPSLIYDLWGDRAEVTGYSGIAPYFLSHRLTRGLGVILGETDEVDDQVGNRERIEITFDNSYYLSSLEIRSLYIHPGYTEQALIEFWNGATFTTQVLSGTEILGTGIGSASYAGPILVDKLVFYPSGNYMSSFAVAQLDVSAEPIPEPGTLLLLGAGLAGIAGYGKLKFRRKKEGK